MLYDVGCLQRLIHYNYISRRLLSEIKLDRKRDHHGLARANPKLPRSCCTFVYGQYNKEPLILPHTISARNFRIKKMSVAFTTRSINSLTIIMHIKG